MSYLLLFIISMAHFSIPISLLYILTVCIRVFCATLFLVNSLMSSMYIKWLIFSCDLLSLYPAMHFLRMWLSGIIAITYSDGDSASPWNIPLWIFTTAKLFPPAVNLTLQIYMVFSINCMIWLGILDIFRRCSIQLWRTISKAFLLSIQDIAKVFRLVLLSSRICGSIYSSFSVPLVLLRHPFCFLRKIPRLINEYLINVKVHRITLLISSSLLLQLSMSCPSFLDDLCDEK